MPCGPQSVHFVKKLLAVRKFKFHKLEMYLDLGLLPNTFRTVLFSSSLETWRFTFSLENRKQVKDVQSIARKDSWVEPVRCRPL